MGEFAKWGVLFLAVWAFSVGFAGAQLRVPMTLVAGAVARSAVCLDGSPPGYHLDWGHGTGVNNWIVQFEGGGWCQDLESCIQRAQSRRGSTHMKNPMATFSGILSNNMYDNPEFYNWNRVKLLYCDGASFAGDSYFNNGTKELHFRGKRIWDALIFELLHKGMASAEKALLSGTSAGGLATYLHCDNFASLLPKTTVKCMGDSGFFLDVEDLLGNNDFRQMFQGVVSLQGAEPNLNQRCTISHQDAYLCFFPQHALPYIKTPFFVLNSAYDPYQINHIFIPPSVDLRGLWSNCKKNPMKCTPGELAKLEVYRAKMLATLEPAMNSSRLGFLIDSCFIHGQSESQHAWFAPNSIRVHNKTISEIVGDWYFDRRVSREVDDPYPSNNSCQELVSWESILF